MAGPGWIHVFCRGVQFGSCRGDRRLNPSLPSWCAVVVRRHCERRYGGIVELRCDISHHLVCIVKFPYRPIDQFIPSLVFRTVARDSPSVRASDSLASADALRKRQKRIPATTPQYRGSAKEQTLELHTVS